MLANPVTEAILDRLPQLGLADCWLTAGAIFQTVWNVLDGRDPQSGISDYDLFYFDAADTSYEAEDLAIGHARAVFADLDATIEVRNEARVHLWYEAHFGVPAKPFTSTRDAIDHFASTTCCVGLTRTASGDIDVYAPTVSPTCMTNAFTRIGFSHHRLSTRRKSHDGYSSGQPSA